MSSSLELAEIRKYVKAHTSNGMDKVEGFLAQLYAKYPETLEFAKGYFKEPLELGSRGSAGVGKLDSALNPRKMNEDAQPSGCSAEAKLELTGAGGTMDPSPTESTTTRDDLVLEILIKYVKEFGMIPQDALKMLRQITKDSYEKLNSRYWDVVGSCIQISTTSPSEGRYDGSKITKITILDSDLEEVKSFEDITPEVWETEIKLQLHTFSTLWFQGNKHRGSRSIVPNTDLKWSDVITEINPYISKLHLDILDFESSQHRTLTGQQISEFIKRYENIKKLKIGFQNILSMHYNIAEGITVDLGKLETVLRGLVSSVQVEVEVIKEEEAVFNRCGDIPNINWIVIISKLEKISQVLVILEQRPNLNITLEIGLHVKELNELRIIAGFSHQFQDKITKHYISLLCRKFEDQDEVAVNNCLRVLSSFVTKLTLFVAEKNWNITEGDFETPWSWPKLRYLNLGSTNISGTMPLAIINNSPKLKTLVLYGRQDIWIFRDPGQSDEDSIQQFFSPLSQLESLDICNVDGKIQDGNKLEGVVKSMLPKLTKFTYNDMGVSKIYLK